MAGTFNKTKGKSHPVDSVDYGALQVISFPLIASVGNSVTSATIQARHILPFGYKVIGLWFNPGFTGGTLPAANASVNVAMGGGAEAGTVPVNDNSEANGYPPTIAVNGNSIFAADKRVDNIAGLTLDVPVFLVADNPDAIWPQGALMTLRLITNGSGTFTNVQVSMACFPYDVRPDLPNGAGLVPADIR